MNEFDIVVKLLVAIGLGFIVGLERDRNLESAGNEIVKVDEKGNLGGIRTYTTISLLGALAGLVFFGQVEVLAFLIFAFIAILVSISYILNFQKAKSLGITTEIATIVTFLLGFLATSNVISLKFTLAFGVVLAFLLSQKSGIHAWASRVKRREVLDIIKYFVVVLAIYPFLPNKDFTLGEIPQLMNFVQMLGISITDLKAVEIINPYSLWSIVVFISGINLLGYFLTKIFDEQRATFLTSFFAGFVSATSLITAHSIKSRETNNSQDHIRLAAGGIISQGSSLMAILFLSFILNFALFNRLAVGLGVMSFTCFAIGTYMLIRTRKTTTHPTQQLDKPIFSIAPAIKLALLIAAVKLISQFGLILLGNAGFYLSIIIASFVALDPVIVTISDLAGKEVLLDIAVLTMFGGIAANAAMKVLTSYMNGEKNFARNVALGLGIAFFVGIVALTIQINII